MVDHEDRSAADKFSVSRLRRSMRGTNTAVPSSVHGAPQVWGQSALRRGWQGCQGAGCFVIDAMLLLIMQVVWHAWRCSRPHRRAAAHV